MIKTNSRNGTTLQVNPLNARSISSERTIAQSAHALDASLLNHHYTSRTRLRSRVRLVDLTSVSEENARHIREYHNVRLRLCRFQRRQALVFQRPLRLLGKIRRLRHALECA